MRVRWRVAAVVAGLVLSGAMPAQALTGSEWLRLPAPARAAYVSGVIDAWSSLAGVQESLGSKDVAITVIAQMVGCLRDRLLAPPAILTIVEKHAEDHPGLRSKDMPDMIFAALAETCRK